MKQGGYVEAVTNRGDYWFLENHSAHIKTIMCDDGATRRAEIRDCNNMSTWERWKAAGHRELAWFDRAWTGAA